MAHHHPHDDGNHHHHHTQPANERRMFFAAILTGLFMVAEVAGGIYSGSLALLADAGHMLTDFAALVMAWVAFRMARRPADLTRTFGAERMQILVAFVNGLTLFFIALMIVKEAVVRLLNPVAVEAPLMTGVALAGLLVNVVVFLVLHGGDKENLNIRGATLHVLGDLLGSLAALAAGGIIMATGKMVADPILSVVVALICCAAHGTSHARLAISCLKTPRRASTLRKFAKT